MHRAQPEHLLSAPHTSAKKFTTTLANQNSTILERLTSQDIIYPSNIPRYNIPRFKYTSQDIILKKGEAR